MHIPMQHIISSICNASYHYACRACNAMKKRKPKRKPTHRDKVSSQGLLGNQEPIALIPSCHAPGFEAQGREGIRLANLVLEKVN